MSNKDEQTAILSELRPVIGTLAHNRPFTPREITEYTRFDRRLDGSKCVRLLVRLGFVGLVGGGKYFPTPAGWNWIEGGKPCLP